MIEDCLHLHRDEGYGGDVYVTSRGGKDMIVLASLIAHVAIKDIVVISYEDVQRYPL